MRPIGLLRFGGIILALAASLALAGCSTLKLGYASLPELAWWWLDGYLDFPHAQRTPVRAQLARLHAWHRQQELPRVADVLARMEQAAPGEIDAGQACGFVQQLRERMDAFAQEAEAAAARSALALAPPQLRHLERKFDEVNARFRQEQVDAPPAERQDRRYQRMLGHAETLYGRLDERQRALLREGLAPSGDDGARILADRQRRQQDLLQTLRSLQGSASEDEARARLRGWLARAQQAPDVAYRQWQEGRVAQACRTFADLHRVTTPAQREHAVQRLRGWQRDLRELAARSL